MMKQFLKYTIVFFSVIIFFVGKSFAQNLHVEAKLNKATIKIGEQAKLFLSVDLPAGEHVDFPALKDTITGKIQLVSTGKRDTVANKQNNTLNIVQGYTITAFDAGSYVIPPFTFKAKFGPVTTNDLVLKVETVKVDTTKSIYDIKQPFTVSYNFWDWLRDNWVWVLAGFILVLLIAGLVYYLKTRPKVEKETKEVKPAIPMHVQMLNKLQELRNKKLWQNGQVKVYHSEISDIMRDYLEKRYEIKAHEKTTDEIFLSLKYMDIATDEKNRLRQILVLADLVKFAKENPPPADNEVSMDNAIRFVMETQETVAPIIKAEGGEIDKPV